MRLFRLFLLTLCTASSFAQPGAQAPAPDPTVNPDHTVTFHFAEPSATAVSVALEGAEPLPMQKDAASGTWSVTTPVLLPERYSYHFNVDGRNELDPHNVTVLASYVASGNGFLVPATPPQPWQLTQVAHGVVHHHTYTTHVVTGLDADQSEYYVYTPPGYDARHDAGYEARGVGATKQYPVLYLLHGWSDTAAGWAVIGHANDIFDNLIASGAMQPAIVVMPLGYGQMSFVRNGYGVWQDAAQVKANVDGFARALFTEVMPAIERDYNTSNRREDRAIAGLSMGGLEAVELGLHHPERFAYVGGFSTAIGKPSATSLPAPDASHPLKLVWIGCGTEDRLIEPSRAMASSLKAQGYPVTTREIPGLHTWLVWRDNLVHFAPLLFHSK